MKTRANHWVRLLLYTAAAISLLGLPGRLPVAQAAPASTITIVVDDGGNTSSPCTVGSVTLRCAINEANAHAGDALIRFAPGLPAVVLQDPLPTITGDFTWIDGHDLSNGCVCPRIDGLLMNPGNGLTINASYVTISNIKIIRIPAAGEDVSIVGGKDIEISYDQLGVLPGATQCDGLESGIGIGVAHDRAGSAGANDNGVAYIFGDTISCHGGSGVEIVDSNYVYVGIARDDATILGNYIGLTPDGLHPAGNGYAGVRVAGNSDQVKIRSNLIARNSAGGILEGGTNIDVLYNTLVANGGPGLGIASGITQLVVGNIIGTSADGLHSAPNTQQGILISGGSSIFLSDNFVAYNGLAGIAVIGNSTHAAIQNNELRNNGGLPIDLGNDGATVNGSHGSVGPNNWLEYPVVTAFSGSLVQGTACANCNIFIYKASGNPAAPGGGGKFQMNVFANSGGQWSAALPNGLTHLDVTMTASDGPNTSEMSPRPQFLLLLPFIAR